jgi:hypothetical protein
MHFLKESLPLLLIALLFANVNAAVEDSLDTEVIISLIDIEKDTGSDLTLGGALRLNYFWQDYNDTRKDKAGDFGLELFRIDVNGDYEDIYLSVQYRWYADFEAIHHGYFGYRLSPSLDAQIGIHQVPFGILPYASHSFWFDATYYLGFEDDYDAGIKLMKKYRQWDIQAAFYKNSEYVDSSRPARYSFDLITSDEQANEEINQVNFRAASDWEPIDGLKINIGSSLELGQIYNQTTRGKGNRWAYALHSDVNVADWNVQLQLVQYSFRPKNPDGVDPSTIQLGAFLYPFFVSAKGTAVNANIAKSFSPSSVFIDKVTFYNDYSTVMPLDSNGLVSIQNVTGCLLVKKGLYIYIDWIAGYNMWFAGGDGIGLKPDDGGNWHSRLNVNFGLYF